jgi:hypothetical protein
MLLDFVEDLIPLQIGKRCGKLKLVRALVKQGQEPLRILN